MNDNKENKNKNINGVSRANVVSVPSNPKKDKNDRKRNGSLGPDKKSARVLTSDLATKNLKKK